MNSCYPEGKTTAMRIWRELKAQNRSTDFNQRISNSLKKPYGSTRARVQAIVDIVSCTQQVILNKKQMLISQSYMGPTACFKGHAIGQPQTATQTADLQKLHMQMKAVKNQV